jgi:hypothetical protein
LLLQAQLCKDLPRARDGRKASPLPLRAPQTHTGAVLIVRINKHHARRFKGAAPLLHRPKLRITATKLEILDGFGAQAGLGSSAAYRGACLYYSRILMIVSVCGVI